MPSPSKSKKKAASTPPSADTLTLQLCDVPCPAGSALLHWESLRRLGCCLGDALFVGSSVVGESALVLRAWASARVPAGRIAITDNAREVLGSAGFSSLHVRLGCTGALQEAATLTVSPLSAVDDDEVEHAGTNESDQLQWMSDQLIGWPVSNDCVLPVRFQGRSWPHRVVAAATAATAISATAPASDGSATMVLRVSAQTRLSLVGAGAVPPSATVDAAAPSPRAPAPVPAALLVAGMSDVIARVREAVELPLFQRALFARLGVPPPTGVLLHGPPGTGKTLLARCVCARLGVPVLELSTASLLSSISGDAEGRLSAAFAEARARSPAVLFLDELDSIGASRDAVGGGGAAEGRLLALLLTEMDGVHTRYEPLLVLGATNRPEALDAALRRPGRLDTEIEVGVPSEAQRREVLAGLLALTPHELVDTQLDELAAFTAGFVGADLAALHRHAALAALGRPVAAATSTTAVVDGRFTQPMTPGVAVKASAEAGAEAGAEARDGSHGASSSEVPKGATSPVEALEAPQSPSRPGLEEGVEAVLEGAPLAPPTPLASHTPHTPHTASAFPSPSSTPSLRSPPPSMVAPKGALTGGAPPGVGDGRPCLTWDDFAAALRVVRPSALREVELRVPRVSWDDIGGQRALKTALTEAVQWPLRHPEAFERMGIRPPRGVLLYGPPGCSKTLAAKALASESRTNFLAVKGPELFSKYVGESERAVASLFRRARAAAPAIIFFDEIDALAAKRAEGAAGAGGVGARVLAQLLHEMDGVQPLSKVLVVAATNRPDLVDPALLRPGRFDALLYVGLPDLEGRLQILRIHTRAMPLADDVDLDGLAARTPNFSGAELAALCREAALAALEVSEAAAAVALEHFERALELVVPRTSPETLAYFSRYEAATRMGGAQAQTAKQPQPPPQQQQQQQFVWPGK